MARGRRGLLPLLHALRGRRPPPPQRQLRAALLVVPPSSLSTDDVHRRLSLALKACEPAPPPMLTLSMHAAAISAMGPCRRTDLVEPLLESARAACLPCLSPADHAAGAGSLYAAALSAFAGSDSPRRLATAEGLLSRMRSEGCEPSSQSLQNYFLAAHGAAEAQPLVAFRAQMQRGMRPRLSVFNAMLAAVAAAPPQRRSGEAASAAAPSVQLLLQVLEVCQLRPNGRTLEVLMQIAQSPQELQLVSALLPADPAPSLSHALLRARLRLDRRALLLELLRRGHAPLPSQRVAVELLSSCLKADAGEVAIGLLRRLRARKLRLSARSVRTLLIEAGEATAAGRGTARTFLEELSRVLLERGSRLESWGATAAHEAIRALAWVWWRAGLADAAAAADMAHAELLAVGLKPRAVLAGTIAFMHVSEGRQAAAVDALMRPGGEVFERRVSRLSKEGPFAAALCAVKRPEQLPIAVGILRAMAERGVCPSFSTRAAFCKMILSFRRTRRLGPPPLRSSNGFWQELPLPPAALVEAFEGEGYTTDELADVLVETRCAALLQRVAEVTATHPERTGQFVSAGIAKLAPTPSRPGALGTGSDQSAAVRQREVQPSSLNTSVSSWTA